MAMVSTRACTAAAREGASAAAIAAGNAVLPSAAACLLTTPLDTAKLLAHHAHAQLFPVSYTPLISSFSSAIYPTHRRAVRARAGTYPE